MSDAAPDKIQASRKAQKNLRRITLFFVHTLSGRITFAAWIAVLLASLLTGYASHLKVSAWLERGAEIKGARAEIKEEVEKPTSCIEKQLIDIQATYTASVLEAPGTNLDSNPENTSDVVKSVRHSVYAERASLSRKKFDLISDKNEMETEITDNQDRIKELERNQTADNQQEINALKAALPDLEKKREDLNKEIELVSESISAADLVLKNLGVPKVKVHSPPG